MKNCSDKEDFMLEAMGILSSLTVPEIDFDKILTELELLPLLVTKLKVREDAVVGVCIADKFVHLTRTQAHEMMFCMKQLCYVEH